MAKKKKGEIDLDQFNIDELLPETVASSRLGRTLASLGATLTGRETHDAKLVYVLLKAGREYSPRLPLEVSITEIPEQKKRTPAEAIKWFAEKYPREAEPLLKKLEERYTETGTVMTYGLKERRDLSDEFYIEVLSRVLSISEDKSRIFYHGIIKPQLEKEEEESRLKSMNVKDKTK